MASTCGGDAEALAAIAADPTLDPFIRGAGMDALLVLAFQGLLAQDRLAGCVATLFGQFEARGDEEDPTAWALLAGCAEEARLFALMPRLEEAFRRGRVDQDVITSGSIQKALELNPGHARRRFLQRHHLVEDAILELEALEYAWQREEIQAMLRERMSADGLPESALKYNLSAGSHAHPRVDPTTAALLGRSGLPDRPAV
jgi:hypothetical protein